MTQEIIDMAQECGLIGMRPHLDGIYSEALVAFAKLVAERALADPMRDVQRLGQEIEQEPPQRTWIGLEGAEFGWFCHTDFLNARKYTKEQRKKICNQLLSEAQSWDIEEYQLMMHDSTKIKENT
jgi:hypothetical protein